jgi:hypothetical protein
VFIWIFKYVSKLTDTYHSGGGLVVIAQSEGHARDLIALDENIVLTSQDWEEALNYCINQNTPEQMIIFPDQGCC